MEAHKLGRKWIGIDLNPEYCQMAKQRIERECSQILKKWMHQLDAREEIVIYLQKTLMEDA